MPTTFRLFRTLDNAVADLFDDRYVTAAACVVDPASATVHYALAGHPPILVAGRSGVRRLQSRGLPLGADLSQGYVEAETLLEPGAALLLYSDGVVETQGPDGTHFGVGALTSLLVRLVSEGPAEIARSLRAAVQAHRGPVPLDDDLTLLAARVV